MDGHDIYESLSVMCAIQHGGDCALWGLACSRAQLGSPFAAIDSLYFVTKYLSLPVLSEG